MDTEQKAKEYDRIVEKGEKLQIVKTAIDNAMQRVRDKVGDKVDPIVEATIVVTMLIEAEGIYDDIVRGIQ